MARYKKSYGFGWITLLVLILLIPLNLKAEDIFLVGYLKDQDKKTIQNLSENNIFLYIDLNGGSLKLTFEIIDEIKKQQEKGKKFYSIIEKNSKAFAASFLITMMTDIVFYENPLNLGASSILSLKSYEKYKVQFDKTFKMISLKNEISEKDIKTFFLNGELFNLKKLTTSKNKIKNRKNTKYINIQETEDITYSFKNYKPNSINIIQRYLYSYDAIFVVLNLLIIFMFISVYFSRRVILKIVVIVLFLLFVYLSLDLPINYHSLFAIIFAHFILMFRNFVKLKYILFIASLSIFIISSILFLDPFNTDFYFDEYGVGIVTIIITFIINMITYKIGYIYFSKRLKSFSKNQNDLLDTEAKVLSIKPLTIQINQDTFSAYSINKLEIGDIVKIVSLDKLRLIIERVND